MAAVCCSWVALWLLLGTGGRPMGEVQGAGESLTGVGVALSKIDFATILERIFG